MPAIPENGEELSNAKGLLFWVLMLVWLIFGLWSNWQASGGTALGYGLLGGNILLFLLLGVLGWKVFGPPLQG